jgi:hypothetical protein
MSQKFRPVAKNDVKAVFVRAQRFEVHPANEYRLRYYNTEAHVNLLSADLIYADKDGTCVRFGNSKNPETARISARQPGELKEQLLSRGVELVDLDNEAACKPQPKAKLKPAL